MIRNNKSLVEFITAFIVMTIVLYIFIRKSNVQIEQRVDASSKTVNSNLIKIKDTIINEIDTIDIKQNYAIDKQFEILDSINVHKEQLIETNRLIKQNNTLLKSINNKQKEILQTIKSEKNYLP